MVWMRLKTYWDDVSLRVNVGLVFRLQTDGHNIVSSVLLDDGFDDGYIPGKGTRVAF